MKTSRFPISLSDRDRLILEHVARHRLTWYPVLQQVFFAGQGTTAVHKVVSRLCRAGLLRTVKLLRRHHGFVLTPESARQFGTTLRSSELPGTQSLAIAFAVLHYVMSAHPSRVRLTRRELNASYPWMSHSWLGAPHSLDGQTCLELIRVDLGGSHDHVARKCDDDIQRRHNCEPLTQLMRQGHFRLVVLTTAKTKADLIRSALDKRRWPDGLSIRLVAIPPLSLLLTKGAHRAS